MTSGCVLGVLCAALPRTEKAPSSGFGAIAVVRAQAGMKRVEANIMSRVKKGKMKEGAAKAAMGLLTGTLTYDDFGSVDMVRRTCCGCWGYTLLRQYSSRLALCFSLTRREL